MIRAVAFDMDGLMFNTEDVYFQVGVRLMERRGGAYPKELCSSIMGCPPQAAFEAMIAWNQLSDSWQELQKESERTFFEILDEYLQPMPGLFRLLDFLEEKRIPKAICTSSSRAVLEGVTQRFDLLKRFYFTISANEITRGKPNPQIYEMAAEKFGIPTREMLVLEDSCNGVLAGANAGAFVAATPAEHSKHMDFSRASIVLDTLEDPRLLDLLCKGRESHEVE
ncbi:MAG: HAD family phosphatase [Planctomycetia bacterium]|nr:HAD family phosphatase [Planctomycetia bacterium]